MQVVEVQSPDESIQTNQTLPICDGDTVVLSVSENNDWLYQWYRDEFEMYQDTSSSLKATKNGEYKVKMTNAEGCSGFSPSLNISPKPNPVPRVTVNGLFISTKSYDNLQWNFNGEPVEDASDPVFYVEESGEYSVTVFHDNGCIATSVPVVVCNPVPTVAIDESWLIASEGSAFQWYFEEDSIIGAKQQKYQVQMSGHYSVDVTRDGCTSRSGKVEVCIPVPEITVKEQDVLEASPGQNYQWYKDNQEIQDADARMYAVKVSGTYKVEVVDFDGCTSIAKAVDVYIDTTDYTPTVLSGISSSGINVYPNPLNSVLYVDISESNLQKIELSLFNLEGKMVFNKTLNYSSEPVPASMHYLSDGMYILRIKTDQKIYQAKIIKRGR